MRGRFGSLGPFGPFGPFGPLLLRGRFGPVLLRGRSRLLDMVGIPGSMVFGTLVVHGSPTVSVHMYFWSSVKLASVSSDFS